MTSLHWGTRENYPLQAEQKLVVLEVESSNTCDTGVAEEAEVHWEEDKQAKLARCSNLKHTFQRTARDCPDVKFLLLEVSQPGELVHIRTSVSHADLMRNETVRGPSLFSWYSCQECCFGLQHAEDAVPALHAEGAVHTKAGR